MGSYWTLTAGRRTLSAGKNYLRDSIALLFTDSELTVKIDPSTSDAEDDADRNQVADVFQYTSTVRRVRSRLAMQGFGQARTYEAALGYLRDVLSDPEEAYRFSEKESSRYDTPVDLLDTVVDWAAKHYWSSVANDAASKYLDEVWRDLIECFDDPRFAISLLIRGARANTAVKLDLSDCVMGGWLEPDERPHLTASARLSSRVSSSGPVIVITEGRTDALFMRRALGLADPGVAHQFTFLDFESTAAPGGRGPGRETYTLSCRSGRGEPRHCDTRQ